MARDSRPPRDHDRCMSDLVVLLVAVAALGLLGILAAHGWTADSRDREWTGSAFAERGLR
jgi:Flp pilus assembly protein CpaB